MKGPSILLVGPSRPGDLAWYCARSFRRLGADVRVLDNRRLLRLAMPGALGKAVEYSRFGPGVMSSVLDRALQKGGNGVDLVFVVKGDHLAPETVARLAENRPVVNWYPDHPLFDGGLDRIGAYSIFYVKDRWSASRLASLGYRNVALLAHASEPDLLYGPNAPRLVDVSVVGRLYEYRWHWIQLLVRGGFSVGVWGDRVPYGRRGVVRVGDPRWRSGPSHGEALRSGTLTLNTHYTADIYGANQRLYDAAAAGAPQVTEHLPDSCAAFVPGEEMLTFRNSEELLEIVSAALCGDVDLRQVGVRSRDRCLSEHTYDHRISRVLKEVGL